jgi:hypothetical protein
VLDEIHLDLTKSGIFGSEFTFLSCGDMPGNQLFTEATNKGLHDRVPVYLRRWMNLEQIWPEKLELAQPPHDFTLFNAVDDAVPNLFGLHPILQETEGE